MKRSRVDRNTHYSTLREIEAGEPVVDDGVPVFHETLGPNLYYVRLLSARDLGWPEHGAVRRFLVVKRYRRWYVLDRIVGCTWRNRHRREAKWLARDLGKRFGAWITIGRPR